MLMTVHDTGLRLVAVGVVWLAASALQMQQPALWPMSVYGAIIVGALGCGFAAWLLRRHGVGFVLVVVAFGALAFAQAGARAVMRVADRLPAALEGRDLRVVGIVASLPVVTAGGQRFRFDVDAAQTLDDGAPAALPATVSVGWYHDEETVPVDVRAGERWRFTLRLKQPHGAQNPHGFDFELWLFEQGIGATGYVRALPPPQRLDDFAGRPIDRLRQHVRDAIYERIGDRRVAGVLAALVVGDQSAIERDDWELFRATGVAHLMSISGLHVTMFAWLAALLVGALWRRSDSALALAPAPSAARWGGLALAAGYALLAGWGVPAQRTVWMLATVTVLRSLGTHWPWPPVLLAAAVVVTAIDPWALLQPGFWLSFAAVGLLLGAEPAQPREASTRWYERLLHSARAALRTQVVATLGLAPLTLVLFQQLSLVGFVANLLAIPLVTLLVTPLALLGALLPPLWHAAALLTQPLIKALGAMSSLPGAVLAVAAAPAWAQAAGLAAGALAVAPLPWRLRLLALPLALPLFAPAVERPAHGRFELTAIDVGQGTAVLVRTREHVLLYDAGPVYSRDSDAGQRVLLPLLRALGATRLDALLLSHRDSDHVGGAAALLGALPVSELLHSLEDGHPLLGRHAAPRRCEAGAGWSWDGVRFQLLHPLAGDVAGKPNVRSCVLRLSGEQGSALLAGDIEAAQERALVERSHEALASDVLLVPHHGSRTSSSDALLDAVQPRVAVVQAGYRNRFGHPATGVIQRYEARGITWCAATLVVHGAGTRTMAR